MKQKKIDLSKLKPSELIRLALADLAAVCRSSSYRVNMDVFVMPASLSDSKHCEVCFAGAVMVQTFGARHLKEDLWIDADAPNGDQFFALDNFRSGDVNEALDRLGVHPACRCSFGKRRQITPFKQSHIWFFADMSKLARDLEGAGL